jgi:hypothetical protein
MKHFMLLSMIYFFALPLVQAQNYRSYRNDDYEKVLKADSVSKKNIKIQ